MQKPESVPKERRRVIVVLNERDFKDGRRDNDLVDYFDNSQALVIPSHDITASGSDALIDRLRRSNALVDRAVLVQSPFDDMEYQFASKAEVEFAVAKFMIVTKLCNLLGATSVRIDQVTTDRRATSWKSSARGKNLVHKANADVEVDLASTVREQLQVSDSFPGSPPDIQAARELLRRTGLENDATLTALVDMREGKNPISRREIIISLTKEASENLKVAVAYSGLKLVTIDTSLIRHVEQQADIKVSVSIAFNAKKGSKTL